MFSHFLRKVSPFGWRVTAAPTRTVRTGRWRWHLTPDADAVLGPHAPDPDRWLADGRAEVVKTGPHRTVYRVALPGGTVYLKHCRIGGLRAWAREVLRPAKARLEFENALALRDRGIPAVVPLGWGGPDSRRPGESFLITRSRDGVVPFVQFTDRVMPTLPPDVRDGVRRQLALGLGDCDGGRADRPDAGRPAAGGAQAGEGPPLVRAAGEPAAAVGRAAVVGRGPLAARPLAADRPPAGRAPPPPVRAAGRGLPARREGARRGRTAGGRRRARAGRDGIAPRVGSSAGAGAAGDARPGGLAPRPEG